MKGKLSKMPRAEHWAGRICAQQAKTVESIIEVGRLLVKAKADLVHGEWGRLFEEELLPFGKSWAAMFMAIAGNRLLVDFHDRGSLPPAVSTLYHLAKADTVKLRNALKDGTVTVDMTRNAVKALMPPKNKTTRRAKPHQEIATVSEEDFSAATRCFFDVQSRIRQTVFDLNSDERDELIGLIRQLLSDIEGEAVRHTA